MNVRRIVVFILFYVSIIAMILFMRLYVQKHYSHEALYGTFNTTHTVPFSR